MPGPGKAVALLLTINIINHHVCTNIYLSKNKYGFTPQLSTIDADVAGKDFVESGYRSGDASLVSLEVEGAFNSTWWPNILKRFQESGCPGSYTT